MTAELVCAASDRGAWLEARRTGVTATDIVTILGLGWSSEYALYWEKLGKLPEWEGSTRTDLGQRLEPYACELLHKTVRPEQPWILGGLYRSSVRPWQLATPDRMTPTEPVELKTWDDHDRAAWEDGMPPKVRAQVLWQMDTLGVGVGHVGVLFLPSGEFESRTIDLHLKMQQGCAVGCEGCLAYRDVDYMRQVGEAFWARVREGLPPFPDGSPATLAAVKALHLGDPSGSVEIPKGLWMAQEDYKAEAKRIGEKIREGESLLRLEMGDAQFGTVDGEPVVKRTRYEVAANTIQRKAYTVDKLTRLGARKDGDDEQA